MTVPEHRKIRDLGHGLFNLRAPFYVGGVLNVGTHMSFVQVESGRFVALSTVPLDPESKAELDQLTKNGDLIEAVVATNPFHTGSFEAFHKAYPHVPMYGTPRHIRNYPQIKWAGSVTDDGLLTRWSPELVLTIPDGCEFDSPQPEIANHFNGVIAIHPASRFMICDDAFETCKGMNAITSGLTGLKNGDIRFHPLFPTSSIFKKSEPDGPKKFYGWAQKVLELDFDNLVTAHSGVSLDGRKEAFRAAIERVKPTLVSLCKSRGVEF
ncbi:hypothetical protein HDU79_004190 [Rhizoclosmatium sp. JEL0117]|nr:hypothetical protein HDU79_004190 [Rhizoclosmatium sp. JEL0117]